MSPTPARSKRILWDQYHNLHYPSGYFPRDNLAITQDTLDWNGDHIHTNFRSMFDALVKDGYHVDVLGGPYSCFDASVYGTLMVVDPEDEFHPFEVAKLRDDILSHGLSVLIFADWYNAAKLKTLQFYDDNSKRQWVPATGGANIPALNDLLSDFGIQFGDRIYQGLTSRELDHPDDKNEPKKPAVAKGRGGDGGSVLYASGTSIAWFPKGGYLHSEELQDTTDDKSKKNKNKKLSRTAVLGAVRVQDIAHFNKYNHAGRLAVYGDSNCLDDAHHTGGRCHALLLSLLRFTGKDDLSSTLFPETLRLGSGFKSKQVKPPARPADNHDFMLYSRVMSIHEPICSLFDPVFFPNNPNNPNNPPLPAVNNPNNPINNTAGHKKRPTKGDGNLTRGVGEGGRNNPNSPINRADGSGEGGMTHLLPHREVTRITRITLTALITLRVRFGYVEYTI